VTAGTWAVVLAGAWCAGSLAVQYRAMGAFGSRTAFAPPAGDPAAGVRYAFLQGLAPGAKESVQDHLPTWALGLVCHGGLGAAFLLLAWTVVRGSVPAAPAAPFLALGALAGGLAALGLLAKRMASPLLRGLSRPGDFAASVLVAAFALLALPALRNPQAHRLWLGTATLLLAWIPLGKLRHGLFFFPTRRAFGVFFGRRGVLPPGRA
jgi:hypothetical protein